MALLDEAQPITSPPPKPKRFDFHAAFSYSSNDAEKVHRIGAALAPKGIKVHDYKTPEGTIKVVGYDLRKTLRHIYQYEAMFVFAFISKAYADSDFTQIEWEVACRAAKHKPGYRIPVLLEKTLEETGMSVSDTCLDGTLPEQELAVLIEGTIRRPPPKPWWFYLSTEVKAAAVAALLALIVAIILILPSRTTIKSVDANAQAITAHVANLGPKSSTLVGYRLKFGTLPVKDAELHLGKAESATIAPGERDVKLVVLTLEPRCDADGNRPNNAEVETLLGQQNVTFEIDVQESDDPPGHPSTRIATIPAARLQPFVRKWVPARVPPC